MNFSYHDEVGRSNGWRANHEPSGLSDSVDVDRRLNGDITRSNGVDANGYQSAEIKNHISPSKHKFYNNYNNNANNDKNYSNFRPQSSS